jgi:type II secretory pathway component PulF
MRTFIIRLCPHLGRLYFFCMILLLLLLYFTVPAFAAEDMWTAANRIIKDIYNKLAGVSTVLAGLMSAVAVIGAKLSNNQHKSDNAWDWLKRIWVAWAVINGIGGFLAYISPLFNGLATLDV